MPRHPGSTRLSAGPSPMTESIVAVELFARCPPPLPAPPSLSRVHVQICAAWAVERGGEGDVRRLTVSTPGD